MRQEATQRKSYQKKKAIGRKRVVERLLNPKEHFKDCEGEEDQEKVSREVKVFGGEGKGRGLKEGRDSRPG